jgi:hypothetical protein
MKPGATYNRVISLVNELCIGTASYTSALLLGIGDWWRMGCSVFDDDLVLWGATDCGGGVGVFGA